MKLRVHCGYAVVALAISLSLVGCARSEPVASDPNPAQVQAIAGTDLHRVILTEQASQNLAIRTEPVREETSSASARSSRSAATTRAFIPMTAVVYDPQGLSWVYTTPAALTFVRVRIVIDHTTADTAYLRSGPPVGTAVVTAGASELLGTEYGVGGE